MLAHEDPLVAPILHLLVSAGYTLPRNSNVSVADTLSGGLAWCISATNADFEFLSDRDFLLQEGKRKVAEVIEAALRSMGCPYPFQAQQIEDLDYTGVYPIAQWVVNRVTESRSKTKEEVTYLLHQIEDEEHTIEQLGKELNNAQNALKMLHAELNEQDLERQESDMKSCSEQNPSDLQANVTQLEENISSCMECKKTSDDFSHSLCDPLEKLNSVKKELAAKLRDLLLLKRRLDDVPSPSELIQYERRFSELYVQIQDKLRQTRKYYATYNAFLEIKELKLKETSLLNSINSQFQDAIASPAGRMKLVESMEGIIRGTQQKLGKVQLAFRTEQKAYDALKEKYAESVAEQRRCSSILTTFQEEYTKNERLRCQISK